MFRHHRRRTIGLLTLILLPLGLLSVDARAAATLYAITGDGATVKETLYTLSQTDASATFVKTLGNGTAGEALGYNPVDGLLYHFSGESGLDAVPPQLNNPATGSIMETINPSTLALNPITIQGTGFSQNSPFRSDEVRGVTYNPAGGNLLVAARDDYYSVSLTGTPTFLGGLFDQGQGFAFVGADLLMLDFDNNPHTRPHLRKINPADGSSISEVEITLAGLPGGVVLDKGIAMDRNPETGQLWVVVMDSGLARRLLTVDPATGVATQVGVLSDNIATIAFTPEPCVTGAAGMMLTFAAARRQRRRAPRRP